MNPYLIIALLLAWVASLAGVGSWQNSAGHVAERTQWLRRENVELRLASAAIKMQEEAARKTERDHAEALASVATIYEWKIGDAKIQHSRDIAALRAGSLRLRDPGTARLGADQCGQLGVASAAGGRDGGQGAGLSDTAAEFLLALAGDADDVVDQLTACQAVIRSDREQ